VLRLNPDGTIQWQNTYGETNTDWAYSVAVASDGDIIVAGNKDMPSGRADDVWVLRLNPDDGTIKWQKAYGGTSVDWAYSVAAASDGDIIVAGYTYSFGAGEKDVWVLRLNPDGTIEWQKTYGGTGVDLAYSVVEASDGDIVVAGYTAPFGAVAGDAWVLRLNPDGTIKWQKTYGGTRGDEANSVAVASDGDIIVAGETMSFGAVNWDVWVLRLNSGGLIPDCEPIASTSVTPQSTSVSPYDTTVIAGSTNGVPVVTEVTLELTDAQVGTQCLFTPSPVGGVILAIDWFRMFLPWLMLTSLLVLGMVAVAFTAKRTNRHARINPS
jgi:uncharacterized delta-60 repeat protein